MTKKRYALVGASGRGRGMYAHPLAEEFTDVAELAGIFDTNEGRARLVSEECGNVPYFTSFDEMMETVKPDAIIVVTVDKFHAEYIIKGIKAGVEVITEKPMCIDADQCREILEAERKYNNKIRVTFNLRFAEWLLRLKELVPQLVGDVYTANLDWMLPRTKVTGAHGASYYRRWNAYMELSGGLLVTKATHHFDMINWLVDSHPTRVSAFGKLRVYGHNKKAPAKRCAECPIAKECEFYTDKDIGDNKKMFADNEKYDGYMIDRCVFDENINIYDSMAINVEYANDAILTYTECSAAAYEGFKLVLNGSKGRLEVNYFEKGGLDTNEHYDFIRAIDLNGNIMTYSFPVLGEGTHGGADPKLRANLFRGEKPKFESQVASATDGAYSVLVGAAANVSIKEGRTVSIDELIKDKTLLERN